MPGVPDQTLEIAYRYSKQLMSSRKNLNVSPLTRTDLPETETEDYPETQLINMSSLCCQTDLSMKALDTITTELQQFRQDKSQLQDNLKSSKEETDRLT